jgi:hypothetical protein
MSNLQETQKPCSMATTCSFVSCRTCLIENPILSRVSRLQRVPCTHADGCPPFEGNDLKGRFRLQCLQPLLHSCAPRASSPAPSPSTFESLSQLAAQLQPSVDVPLILSQTTAQAGLLLNMAGPEYVAPLPAEVSRELFRADVGNALCSSCIEAFAAGSRGGAGEGAPLQRLQANDDGGRRCGQHH